MNNMLDPHSTFDTFDIGPANRLAAAAARSAAQAPGTAYNPLVIYGAKGVGKTHLLTAMGHLARSVNRDIEAHYEPVDVFVDRLTTAIAENGVHEFRTALSGLDLLILDDLQNLSGKHRSQQELIEVWGRLIDRSAQIVVAADRPPHEIEDLDDRLVARLEEGLVVDLGGAEEAEPATGAAESDEFSDFLSDVSSTVAAVVEGAPWRKALAQAILRWEGEGIRTRRLESALEADSAPDLDALLGGFGEDVRRLREISADLQAVGPTDLDPALLYDPDRLQELQAILDRARPSPAPVPRPAPRVEDPASSPAVAEAGLATDRWFFRRDKIDWAWAALDDRLLEEMG
ncbi:MAG TPA: DnaA/Hda family protein [Longimicrobiaceae bacterium]|nr:DnaA/Hda family protein [Longimicrobiaceae bacterium]